VCKASHEAGGPQRCSGDARTNLERSQADVQRKQEWLRNLEEHMNGEPKQWGPNIGPPPFAPPFGPNFDEWFQRQNNAAGGTLSREDAYIEFYNLAGDPEDWARQGYSARPSTATVTAAAEVLHEMPEIENMKSLVDNFPGTGNSSLHAALRKAVAERTDADLDELDAEVSEAVRRGGR